MEKIDRKKSIEERAWRVLLAVFIVLALSVSGCSVSTQQKPEGSGAAAEQGKQNSAGTKNISENAEPEYKETEEQWEKGYDLPLSQSEKEEAEADCIEAMGKIRSIYKEADKGNALNPTPDRESILKMYEALQETGCPVAAAGFHYTMGNYEEMERFLEDCRNGIEGNQVLYKISLGGGVNRSRFIFDGADMYVIDTVAAWNAEDDSAIAGSSFNRIKEWKYTEKGWFAYEYCMPEFPEVTEIANGNNLYRVKPMPEEYIKIAEAYLLPIGYLGNNLFRTDWDGTHLEGLDYNGLYEYLYALKYQRAMGLHTYADGIPKEEFEALVTEYLPVTAEELSGYAVFDAEKQTYGWERLGPVTYMANQFSTSIPEVREIKKNPDGTAELTVDAVCGAMGEDCVMSHVLTVQIREDGGIRYLGNRVLGEGIMKNIKYQYRLPQTDTDSR